MELLNCALRIAFSLKVSKRPGVASDNIYYLDTLHSCPTWGGGGILGWV